MRHCEIGGMVVDCSAVTVDFHSFGKALSPQYATEYRLTVDFVDAIESFSDFYRGFLEREAEDEGFEEGLEGDYLRLQETGYLPFERMLNEQPELLASVLLKLLPSEFMGYLFRHHDSSREHAFVLQTLKNVEIGGGRISCEGTSFSIPK